MKWFKLHECKIATSCDAYGSAINHCDEDDKGRFWAGNGEYESQVKFCPECGTKAPNQDLTADPKPEAKPFDHSCCEKTETGYKRTIDCWHINVHSTTDLLTESSKDSEEPRIISKGLRIDKKGNVVRDKRFKEIYYKDNTIKNMDIRPYSPQLIKDSK